MTTGPRSARRSMLPVPDAASGEQHTGISPVGSRPINPDSAPPRSSSADVVVGIVFGLLAGSNLVQGAWLENYPWLNLTTAAFVLAVPIALVGFRRRTTIPDVLILLLLLFALAVGYLAPALNANADLKRVNIAVTVAFVVIASYLSLTNPRRIKWFFVTLVCLAVPVVVGQVVVPDPLALMTGRRTPLGLNAIGAGRAVGAALVLVLAVLIQHGPRRRRLALGMAALVLCAGLYLDGSRGPVVGALVAVIALLGKHPTIRRGPKLVLFVTLCLVTALAYERSISSGSRLADSTTSGRDELYRQAARIAVEHPLGIGWGNFYRFAPSGLLGSDQSGNLYAHNILLEFWIEAGVLGALAFAVVAVAILVSAFRSASRSAGGLALAALLVNLLMGAMLSSDVIGNRMMWVVFGAVLARAATQGVSGFLSPSISTRELPARPDR